MIQVIKTGKEVRLRMRVIGLDIKSGEMEVVHAPLFADQKALKEAKNV